MSEPRIPTIDLRPWLSGDTQVRRETAATVDAALRAAGFLLVTGHGMDPDHGNPYNKAVPVVEPAREDASQRFVAITWPEGKPPARNCLPPSAAP